MRPLLAPVFALTLSLGMLSLMTVLPQPAGAQADSAILRPEPGWPSLQVLEPRAHARYPQGASRGVPVSFRVHGAELFRNGFRVAVIIDGRRYIRTDEATFQLTQLAAGSHQVRFELLDRRGELVPGGTSVQERTFHVGPRKSAPKKSPKPNPQLSIAPRSYQAPATTVDSDTNPKVSHQQGFSVRAGGRREGPVPKLEAPGADDTPVESTAKELNRPENAVLPTAAPSSPTRTPSLSTPAPTEGRRESAPSSSSSTTISESMRRTLLETGRRVRPTPDPNGEDRLVTIQADAPTTSSAPREGNR